jgi:acyl-CoA dehydrogenase|tara:strand:- start:586 stop:1626 length:1041 start_codon:yes stop_codon:yes gene_type:complete
MLSETSQILSDTVEKIFSDNVTKQCIINSEKGEWPKELWNEIIENGLNLVLVPEALGGVGGSWFDAGILFKAIGKYQAPIPLAENIVAGHLLGLGGIPLPDDSIVTILDGEFSIKDNKLSGISKRTPFGSSATHGVALINDKSSSKVILLSIPKDSISDDKNLALESRSNIDFMDVEILSSSEILFSSDYILKIGALMRSCQIAGGLEFLLDQSVKYANDRIQFGRPIAKFQAIQQELAVLATHVAASGVAADYASSSMDDGCEDLAIASAKSRVDDAVSIGASIAHQVHGAIGFTYEHGLHFATRRLWSWRAEYGSGSYWAKSIGQKAVASGSKNFWPSITTGKI